VTSQEEVDALMAELEAMEDWLYEDEGLEAETKVYKDKRSELKKKVDAIFLRTTEMKERPVVVGETRGLLKALVAQVGTWEKERPWVTQEEREALLARVEGVQAWLDEVSEKQEALSPRDVPAFLCSDVRAQLEPIQRGVEFLLKKRKPKPKAPKKAASAKKDGDKDAGEDAKADADADAEADQDEEKKTNEADEDTAKADGDDEASGEETKKGEEEEEEEDKSKDEL
jgi:heat shock protein 4